MFSGKFWSQEQIKIILLSAWKQNKNHATFLIIYALELATFFKNTHLNELWLYHLAWRNWILVTNVIKPFFEIEHEHKYVWSRASKCLSLSSPFPLQWQLFKLYSVVVHILHLASTNFISWRMITWMIPNAQFHTFNHYIAKLS